jgi:hypothetical protein
VLNDRVGESTFEIWLAGLELLAVDSQQRLVIACPPAIRGWIAARFSALLEDTAAAMGRDARLATDVERQLLTNPEAGGLLSASTAPEPPVPANHREAI